MYLLTPYTMSNTLNTHHQDWVEEQVRESWEQSQAANSALTGLEGIPPHPELENVLRLTQAALTAEQVDFMMEAGEADSFTYQTRLSAPNDRLVELIAQLIGERSGLAHRLPITPPTLTAPIWHWEFGQGGLLTLGDRPWHDGRRCLSARVRDFQGALPAGMRGTDLFSWATRIAASRRTGVLIDRPVNLNLPGTESNNGSYTVLDREICSYDTLVGGTHSFNRPGETPTSHQVVRSFSLDDIELADPGISFRMTIDGPVLA